MLFAVTVFTSVYCEAAKVPAATTILDKAALTTYVALGACPNGAIIAPVIDYCGLQAATIVEIYALVKIHWAVDETFYLTGYKDLLNKEPVEILAPPKQNLSDRITSRKNLFNSKSRKGATGRNPRDGLRQI